MDTDKWLIRRGDGECQGGYLSDNMGLGKVDPPVSSYSIMVMILMALFDRRSILPCSQSSCNTEATISMPTTSSRHWSTSTSTGHARSSAQFKQQMPITKSISYSLPMCWRKDRVTLETPRSKKLQTDLLLGSMGHRATNPVFREAIKSQMTSLPIHQ